MILCFNISAPQDTHKMENDRENPKYMETHIKNESEMSSQRKDSSSSIAHLEYLRALTKHYQQQSYQSYPQPNNLAAYQELLLQQQQKHNQQQFLQLNQRRSMEDVLKKLATAGKDCIDPKGNKVYDLETLR
jgi:hypothetical protein